LYGDKLGSDREVLRFLLDQGVQFPSSLVYVAGKVTCADLEGMAHLYLVALYRAVE
jgi:hypothetical protein